MFVRVTVDPTGVLTGTRQAGVALTRFAGTAGGTSLNVNKLGGTLLSLTTQLTGVNPAVARLTNILGAFAIGAPWMIGILAGITAVSAGWQLWTRDARAAAAEVQKLIAKYAELARVRVLGGAGAGADAMSAITRRQEIREKLDPSSNRLFGLLTRGQIADLKEEFTGLGVVIQEAGALMREVRADEAKAALEAAGAIARAAEKIREAGQKVLDQRLAWAGEGINIGKLVAASVARSVSTFNLTPTTKAPDMAALQPGGWKAAVKAAPGEALDAFTSELSLAKSNLLGFGAASLGVTAAFKVLDGIMVPLQPILDIILSVFQSIGELLGSLIAPVLKLVATGFSWVLQAIGFFVEGIGKFIDAIVPDWISKVGKGLAAQGQSMQDHAKAMRESLNAADGVTAAFEGLTAATRNVPAGFKTNLSRFNATSTGTVGSAPGSTGNPIETFTITGDLHFHGVQNVEDLGKQVRRLARRGGGVPLQPAYE